MMGPASSRSAAGPGARVAREPGQSLIAAAISGRHPVPPVSWPPTGTMRSRGIPVGGSGSKLARVRDQDQLTPTAVPFQLRPDAAGIVFVESSPASRNEWVFVALLPVLVAVATTAGISLGTSVRREVIVLAICTLTVGVLVAIVFRISCWKRTLRYDRSSGQVVVQRSTSAQEEARRGLDECRFAVHPVQLVVVRNRWGSVVRSWSGYAAVVHVGASRFVLACDQNSEAIRSYARSLPGWLPALDVEERKIIEADAHRRI